MQLIFLTACSSYKTNTSLRFTDRFPREQPAIPIGKLNTGNENLTYLGWVNAEVSKPLPLAKPPTKQQVNLVLAELGRKLDADAVTFVAYKTGLAGNTLFAKGQAVQFKNRPRALETAPLAAVATAPTSYQSTSKITTTLPAVRQQPSIRYKPSPQKTFRQLSDDEIALIISNAMYLESQSASMQRTDMELSAKVIRDLIEKSQKVR